MTNEYFSTPIKRFQPDHNASLRSFVEALGRTGGQPRRLARAIELWDAMLERQRVVFCSIAGAPVPLGFGPAIASLIERRSIDVLDVTGAQITHDMLETIGSKHYQGVVNADDAALAAQDVNRFWDTFGSEADYRRVEPMIFEFAQNLPDRPLTTREYVFRLGSYFKRVGSQSGFITAAAEAGVPVYCPAIGDSVLGMNLGLLWTQTGRRIVFDVVQDVLEMSAIVLLAEELGRRTSTVIFGGGAPRNHIQQSQIGSYMFMTKSKGHAEAVRFSIEPTETGGLSGSTISEGISWKKFDPNVEAAEVFLDSNLALAVSASLSARVIRQPASNSCTKTMARSPWLPPARATTSRRNSASRRTETRGWITDAPIARGISTIHLRREVSSRVPPWGSHSRAPCCNTSCSTPGGRREAGTALPSSCRTRRMLPGASAAAYARRSSRRLRSARTPRPVHSCASTCAMHDTTDNAPARSAGPCSRRTPARQR